MSRHGRDREVLNPALAVTTCHQPFLPADQFHLAFSDKLPTAIDLNPYSLLLSARVRIAAGSAPKHIANRSLGELSPAGNANGIADIDALRLLRVGLAIEQGLADRLPAS